MKKALIFAAWLILTAGLYFLVDLRKGTTTASVLIIGWVYASIFFGILRLFEVIGGDDDE